MGISSLTVREEIVCSGQDQNMTSTPLPRNKRIHSLHHWIVCNKSKNNLSLQLSLKRNNLVETILCCISQKCLSSYTKKWCDRISALVFVRLFDLYVIALH